MSFWKECENPKCTQLTMPGELCRSCSVHDPESHPKIQLRKRLEKRKKRLKKCGGTELYHQTLEEFGKVIVETQTMKKGKRAGMAGRGIYFAEEIRDTYHKARFRHSKSGKKCVVLVADVKLGKVLVISKHGDKSITFSNLLKRGYDSVMIPRDRGHEYVVYNSDQVMNIRSYEIYDISCDDYSNDHWKGFFCTQSFSEY